MALAVAACGGKKEEAPQAAGPNASSPQVVDDGTLAAGEEISSPKGEVVLVLGPPSAPPGGGPGTPAGLDGLRRLVEAGAHPRKAATVVAELTGGSANELYRALTSGD